MLAALAALPIPDLLVKAPIDAPLGSRSYYRADTVVRLLAAQQRPTEAAPTSLTPPPESADPFINQWVTASPPNSPPRKPQLSQTDHRQAGERPAAGQVAADYKGRAAPAAHGPGGDHGVTHTRPA